MARAITVAGLHRKLTQEFNRYIRLRDTFNRDGIRLGECISCKAELPYERLQAGHFIPANHYYLRYNESNVNAQCVQCNKWKHGNPFGYMLGLRELYDYTIPYELAEQMNWRRKYTAEELERLISLYKVKQLGVE